MAYKVYDTAQGPFCIDWDTCVHIIKSYHRADFQSRYSNEVTESQVSINPMTWGLPSLSYIEVDWPKVNQEASGRSILAAYRLGAIAIFQKGGVDVMVHELLEMQQETRRLNARFREDAAAASRRSWKAMESAVSTYGNWVNGLQIVRDGSASVVVGAATVATGGAAVALAGGGTILKAAYKYQDTGLVGVAAIEATQNVICYLIPATKAGTALKVVVTATSDAAKAVLQPESSGWIAFAAGAIGGLASAGGSALKKALEFVLPKTAAPVIAKVLQDISKKKAQSALVSRASSTSVSDDARLARGGGLASHITLDDDWLLKLAVVDMTKGVGRSWW